MGVLMTGLIAAFLPMIEPLLAGLGTWIMAELTKLMGNPAAAQAKASEAVTAAERITMNVTTDADAALKWVEGQFNSFAALEAMMPGSMQAIQAKSILMDDVGVPHGIAAHAVQIGLANGRVKAGDHAAVVAAAAP